MARWTLAGSFGYVGGPLLRGRGRARARLAGGSGGPRGRGAAARLRGHTLPAMHARAGGSLVEVLREALAALRRRDVLQRLPLLEAADLLLDVFHGFLALYLVDVAGVRPAAAALGVGGPSGTQRHGRRRRRRRRARGSRRAARPRPARGSRRPRDDDVGAPARAARPAGARAPRLMLDRLRRRQRVRRSWRISRRARRRDRAPAGAQERFATRARKECDEGGPPAE
jgi:hypothetical protein